jgi:hypothetical protein
MKTELEEAASKYANEELSKELISKVGNFYGFSSSFIKGAKWQAKRSYSEEEVEIILKSYKEFIVKELKGLSSFKDKTHWFEQFKKK